MSRIRIEMGNVEIPDWLKGLALAPVYRPTETEFADPIAYISKIEKEASAFGICKIIPPLPKPSKKYVFYNLNKSFLRCPELTSDVDTSKMCQEDRAVFTTRQQELGQSGKRTKGGASTKANSQRNAVKQVWQSGGVYTLEQFESKSKAFYRSQLGTIKEVSPLVVETLFWKAASEKPIYIEYANDVPGSAFGEPEGHFRHVRRRRGRGSYQRKTEINDETKVQNQMDRNGSEEPSSKNGENTLPEVEKASLASPSLSFHLGSHSSKQKTVDFIDEMESTAGWKLSNSSWNLQMIARSPGSVTRFMPDDIPGVTSPMVYIGMLFSWFAWHIEDHELHSMNYLHTGSPKTWYAVPGDYALEFEEVIRKKSYAKNTDQLAALTQLGAKTTLVSPEMIVASGIPCCRLVQNPGEFVVTFPRSYHVGFSHGFNCGEAANFGTPQWLTVAKEAAVRRAAMNYLPMLSHQQLLYLLTMSFVLRVPRSLLPGGRSSRLRDRQREEREFLVKKAFVEDILNENKNLSVLLQEPGFRLVMWDPDLLPRHSAAALAAAGGTAAPAVLSPAVAKGEFEGHPEMQNKEKTTLLEELRLSMEKLNDVYYDDDDGLLNDFQVDTGTLACVACGVLGFPFMSVVQPSEKALKDFLQRQGEIDDPELMTPSSESSDCKWNTSCRYRRPRIFCLDHTIELQTLLQSRDALNFLVICHKDFLKIKAHAALVAEEVKIPFSYDDVLLETASQEDLSLIDLAIEDEENNEHGVDWSSKLGINLRCCVKVRKNYPTKKIQHAMSLGGLFSDTSHMLDISTIKWLQRKSRSKCKPSSLSNFKPREHFEVKKDGRLWENLDSPVGRKEEKIIQYSRKKKLNSKHSGGQVQVFDNAAKSKDFDKACNKVANRSYQGGANHNEMDNEIRDFERAIGRDGESFDEDPCSSSFAESHREEHLETTVKFGSTLDGNVTNNCSMVIAVSLDPTSVTREQQAHSVTSDDYGLNSSSHVVVTQTLSAFTGNNHDEQRKLSAEYVCNDVCGRYVQEAVGTSDQEFEEPRSTVTNTKDEQQSQQVAPIKDKIVSSDDTQVEGEDAPCSENIMQTEPQQVETHSLAQLGMGVPETNIASENIVVDMAHDMEPPTRRNLLSLSGGGQASSNDLQTPDDEFSMASEVASSENSEGIKVPNSNVTEAKKKRKIESDSETNNNLESKIGFIRSPCEGLRSRGRRETICETSVKLNETSNDDNKSTAKRLKKTSKTVLGDHQEASTTTHHRCHVEGCRMTFVSKTELQTHKKNRCTEEGCGKKFRAHKYLLLHQRVHNDDRPFECPWKGCSMTFKWQWARTEHLRLHTGERPYKCKVEGCGLSFRFVSDYSRHRRKTGHYVT